MNAMLQQVAPSKNTLLALNILDSSWAQNNTAFMWHLLRQSVEQMPEPIGLELQFELSSIPSSVIIRSRKWVSF
jgi:hypothetical protein